MTIVSDSYWSKNFEMFVLSTIEYNIISGEELRIIDFFKC